MRSQPSPDPQGPLDWWAQQARPVRPVRSGPRDPRALVALLDQWAQQDLQEVQGTLVLQVPRLQLRVPQVIPDPPDSRERPGLLDLPELPGALAHHLQSQVQEALLELQGLREPLRRSPDLREELAPLVRPLLLQARQEIQDLLDRLEEPDRPAS